MSANSRNCTLSPKQEIAALAIARGAFREVAAVECGASARTVKAWLHQPTFRQRVHQLRTEITSQALGRLIDNMVSASDTLGYLSRRAKNEMVRFQAAAKIIDSAIKVREATELAERVAALEAKQQSVPRSRIA